MKEKDFRIRIWIKALLRMIAKTDWRNKKELIENLQLVYGFCFSGIHLLKRAKYVKRSKAPILIAIVRDEIERMELFLEHYRLIGIEHFVIADNGSNDGTLEYLLQQNDIDVFYIGSKFRNGRKEGWINRLMYFYGFHRWYLIVDADELLEWPERKEYALVNVIKVLELNKINRAGAIMLDMYSAGGMYKYDLKSDKNVKLYFDSDTYTEISDGDKIFLTGGPRKRIYNMDCYLSKYPLVYLNEGEILINAHYWYPYFCFNDYPFIFGLLHYKLLSKTDLKKVKQYVSEQNHVNHSYEYKCYLEQYKRRNIYFYYEASVPYGSSEDLSYVRYIKKISEFDDKKKNVGKGNLVT